MESERIPLLLESVETDRILKLKIKKFSSYLIEEKGLFGDEFDLKIFILQQMCKVLTEEVCDCPITFDGKKEKLKKVREEKEQAIKDAPEQIQLKGIPIEREEH